jgi:Na+/phosphate symporter
MVGILSTVLVQSSSTSTSIVVGLVGAGQLSVHNAATTWSKGLLVVFFF